ncbi:MAG: methylated-DNA--[Clostridia bacterium]|nr:methylated-DNA--[protein]-cysteine S-methyltransferase [Clostridia bacterium]
MNLKEKITVPNCITSMRILGALCMGLPYFEILSPQFFIIYTLCGVTDVLDGFIARMTKKTTEFGAKLDSVADLLFYGVMLIKLLPRMLGAMPNAMPWMIVTLLAIRVVSYSIAAFKHKKFASLHTYMNKLTGLCGFSMPYLIKLLPEVGVYTTVYIIAMIAACEELTIHVYTATYKTKNRNVITAVKGEKTMGDFYSQVYEVVKKIPVGKVATYTQVAEMLGNKNLARAVGNALHNNPDYTAIPCHRVVKANGKLAENYAFGGLEGQKQHLINEGVEVCDNRVDLEKYKW